MTYHKTLAKVLFSRGKLRRNGVVRLKTIILTVVIPWHALVAHSVSGPWPAPNFAEAAAIEQGQALGAGTVEIIGPTIVEVRSFQTWTLRYTVGRAGLKPGGSILIGMRHMQHLACAPQVKDPKLQGYVSLAGETSTALELDVPSSQIFPIGRFFPWQHIVRAKVGKDMLAPGAVIDIVLGDTSQGGPGMRVQPFDETNYGFKLYTDLDGSDTYYPLAETPTVEIIAASATALMLTMPSNAMVGEPSWCLVRAEDAYGNPAASYRGTVTLSNGRRHTFTKSDQGVYRFKNIVFSKPGTRTLSVEDGELRAQGNPVLVTQDAEGDLLLWGDLHGHTLFSDGRGTVEEFYDFADRVAGLDFCAVTDHAYQVRDEMWEATKRATNAAYRPGEFVTFHAFEWSGVTPLGGDHNVFFLEEDPPIYRSSNMYDRRSLQMQHDVPKQVDIEAVYAEMLVRLKNENIFCIPHYGGRMGNPKYHNPKVQRMIEIFSEHRRSENWANQFLTQGYRLGIMASTDGHYGNPGHGFLKYKNEDKALSNAEIGMASVAVYARERTRESIFKSLYARRVYATSGDRIVLDFAVDGHPMGSEFECNTAPTLTVHVEATAPVTLVELKKNGAILHTASPGSATLKNLQWQDPTFAPDEPVFYYVRIVQENSEEAISSPVWVN